MSPRVMMSPVTVAVGVDPSLSNLNVTVEPLTVKVPASGTDSKETLPASVTRNEVIIVTLPEAARVIVSPVSSYLSTSGSSSVNGSDLPSTVWRRHVPSSGRTGAVASPHARTTREPSTYRKERRIVVTSFLGTPQNSRRPLSTTSDFAQSSHNLKDYFEIVATRQ